SFNRLNNDCRVGIISSALFIQGHCLSRLATIRGLRAVSFKKLHKPVAQPITPLPHPDFTIARCQMKEF
ncbi:MAG: hypothetical protein ACLQU3_08805, partial [Limisphaerales bacterium]